MTMKRLAILVLLSLTCYGYAQDKKEPTTLKGVLLQQLQTTHNVKEWFVPVDVALDGLTADQANWTDGKGNHSIAQEVSHLLFWDAWALAKFKGEPQAKFSGNNDDTFTSVDSKQWVETCKKLDQVLAEWEQAVQAADDKKIAASASMIAHVGTHNAYHIGQIVYIRKLQGSWNASKGVH
jgi:hypothetical protein